MSSANNKIDYDTHSKYGAPSNRFSYKDEIDKILNRSSKPSINIDELRERFLCRCIEDAASRLGCGREEMRKRLEAASLTGYLELRYDIFSVVDHDLVIDNLIYMLLNWELTGNNSRFLSRKE